MQYLMTEDMVHHVLSQVRCNRVAKLVHRHYVFINLEGQVNTAETGGGEGGRWREEKRWKRGGEGGVGVEREGRTEREGSRDRVK